MTKNLKRLPTFTTDGDGVAIARVPLANGTCAIVETADWEDLLSRGLTPHWTLNDDGKGRGYVRCQGGGNLVMVSRQITGARRGEIVGYRNGDRRDLRRSNLYVTRGGRAKPRLAA